MKFLVIILCLLSERFLIHASAYNRFQWFTTYVNSMEGKFAKPFSTTQPWLKLIIILLPLLIISSVIFYLFDHLIFGLLGFLLNLIIFYHCIGPGNPFYPNYDEIQPLANQYHGGEKYLIDVNGQLFAVIFWYIVFGPLGALFYRLVSLCQKLPTIEAHAVWLTNVLDWLPARATALLYMLVGNFQAALEYFTTMFFTLPIHNQALLSTCGLKAMSYDKAATKDATALIPQAERLVEHALLAFLALFAIFMMMTWL